MYERYYGLRERPFDLTPNPRYLFLSAKHREALSHLHYGISGRRGITVLIGEAGTGKTTLVHAALEQQREENTCAVYLSNPLLSRSEFFEFLAWGFGLDASAETSKTRFVLELTRTLAARLEAGGTSALVIDEAQCLSHELMEEIRLLANIETTTDKLLPVVMVGQPELADCLNEPSLRQLKQRVASRCNLPALDAVETAAYVSNRLAIAGGASDQIFTESAIETIFEHSRGIPRTVSVICDNALLTGFAADERPIGRDTILEVCRDFDLRAPGGDDSALSPGVSPLAAMPGAPRTSSFF
jgi:general secretion pathway protein A